MASNLATSQISVGASAVQLVAPRTLRRRVYVRNAHATQTLYLGASSGVTTGTGFPVPAGTMVEIETDGALFGIASGAGTTTALMETFEP